MKKIRILFVVLMVLCLCACTKEKEPTTISVPTATNVPVPTETPAETSTPAATSTPALTDAPMATSTLAPTNTLAPTDTPIPTSTPTPASVPVNVISNAEELEKTLIQQGAKGSKATGFITTKNTTFETEYLNFEIEKNIYIPSYLAEKSDEMCKGIEAVTGLSFKGGRFSDCKINVSVQKHNIFEEGMSKSEVFSGACAWNDNIIIMPGDLLLGNSTSFAHELAHALENEYDNVLSAGMVLTEGFSTNTEYFVSKYFEENDHEMAAILYPSDFNNSNYSIDDDGDALYEQPLKYWMDNGFEGSGNGLYSIGYRLLQYFKDLTGSYSGWIKTFSETYNANEFYQLTPEEQINLIEKAYGSGTADGFYTWVKNHKASFDVVADSVWDLSNAKNIVIFPEYNAIGNETKLGGWFTKNVKYNDLCIDLVPYKFYLEEYKGEYVGSLILHSTNKITIERFDADGKSLGTVTDNHFPISGLSKIKLVGEGRTGITIDGYEAYGYDFGEKYLPVPTDSFEADNIEELMLLLVSISDHEITATENMSFVGGTVPKYARLLIKEGKTFLVDDYMFLDGSIEGDINSVKISDAGWVWLERGGHIKRGDVEIKVTAADSYMGPGLEDYGCAVRIDNDDGKWLLSMGYKTIIDITIPAGEKVDDYFIIGDMRTDAEVYVNGVKVK